MSADRMRRCWALDGPSGLQCEGEASNLTQHVEDHWANVPGSPGEIRRWKEEVAVYRIANPERTKLEGYVTKDSGSRAVYDSGMVRDTQEGKARFDLLLATGVPYEKQFLTRIAELMQRGAEKYCDRNWERADSVEELERFRSSALRHLMQWAAGDAEEDHAAAVVFNLLAHETTKTKMEE